MQDLGDRARRPALAAAQDASGLTEPFTVGDELGGIRGIKSEHLEMVGNDNAGTGSMGEGGGFSAAEIPGNTPRRIVAIDREQGDGWSSGGEERGQFLMPARVA